MVHFIMLYKVVLTVESVDEILTCDRIQMKVREPCFPVVLFIMLYFLKLYRAFSLNFDLGKRL